MVASCCSLLVSKVSSWLRLVTRSSDSRMTEASAFSRNDGEATRILKPTAFFMFGFNLFFHFFNDLLKIKIEFNGDTDCQSFGSPVARCGQEGQSVV